MVEMVRIVQIVEISNIKSFFNQQLIFGLDSLIIFWHISGKFLTRKTFKQWFNPQTAPVPASVAAAAVD
jgi:hypothetical protein